MARRSTATIPQHPPTAADRLANGHGKVSTLGSTFSFGDFLWAARNAHREFRNRDRLEQHLGWPHRKSLWLEHDRIKPTADDLAQLRATLPILRLLLDHARPAPREIETAWHV